MQLSSKYFNALFSKYILYSYITNLINDINLKSITCQNHDIKLDSQVNYQWNTACWEGRDYKITLLETNKILIYNKYFQ